MSTNQALDKIIANYLAKIISRQNQSVDELMVVFKGRHGLKQYIKNKPHRRGFTLWARCDSDSCCMNLTFI